MLSNHARTSGQLPACVPHNEACSPVAAAGRMVHNVWVVIENGPFAGDRAGPSHRGAVDVYSRGLVDRRSTVRALVCCLWERVDR